jgi:TRAP-type C4-dicarboxylate transport system permease large subunit
MQLGFDPIWLGVLLVKAGEIGIVTPPMGLNVFVVSSVTRVPVNTVFRGIWAFVAAEFVLLGVLIAWPGLSLWLANYAS